MRVSGDYDKSANGKTHALSPAVSVIVLGMSHQQTSDQLITNWLQGQYSRQWYQKPKKTTNNVI